MAKKKFTAQEQERIKQRIEFVQANPDLAPAEARKRFYVKTRAQELSAAGKEVNRKALRQKFETGGVTRKGFYTPGDLQRIASEKAAASKSSPTDVTNNANAVVAKKVNVAGPIVRAGVGQAPKNLAEEKIDLNKPNQLANDWNYMRKHGFYDTALGQIKADGSMTPLGKFFYKIGEMTVGSLESTQATFINPAINLAGKALNKLAGYENGKGGYDYNPKLREATGKEAAFNTAMTAIDIAAAGQASALKAALGPVAEDVVLTSGRGLKSPGKPHMGPEAPGKSMSTYRNLAEGRGMKFRAAETAEPVQIPGIKSAGPKTPKTRTSKPKTSTKSTKMTNQEKVDFVKSPEFGAKVEQATGGNIKVKSTKTTRTTAKTQVDLQAKADQMIETGVSNATKPKATRVNKPKTTTKTAAPIDPMINEHGGVVEGHWQYGPTMPREMAEPKPVKAKSVKTKVSEAKVLPETVTINGKTYTVKQTKTGLPSWTSTTKEAPAPAVTPKPKKKLPTTREAFVAKAEEVAGKPVSSSANMQTVSFGSQEEYNTWLRTGGKEQLRNATQAQRDAFAARHRSLAEGLSKQVSADEKRAAARLARKRRVAGKYKAASPAVQERYNKLITYADTSNAMRLARMRGISK